MKGKVIVYHLWRGVEGFFLAGEGGGRHMIFWGNGERPVASKRVLGGNIEMTINEEGGHNGKMRAHVLPLQPFDR